MIAFVEHAEQIDGSLGVSPGEVVAALGSDDPPRLIDVRSPAEWDPSVPRYELAPDLLGGGASMRPLRSAVSEAEGCQSSEGAR